VVDSLTPPSFAETAQHRQAAAWRAGSICLPARYQHSAGRRVQRLPGCCPIPRTGRGPTPPAGANDSTSGRRMLTAFSVGWATLPVSPQELQPLGIAPIRLVWGVFPLNADDTQISKRRKIAVVGNQCVRTDCKRACCLNRVRELQFEDGAQASCALLQFPRRGPLPSMAHHSFRCEPHSRP
jgi:hypothetical protein